MQERISGNKSFKSLAAFLVFFIGRETNPIAPPFEDAPGLVNWNKKQRLSPELG